MTSQPPTPPNLGPDRIFGPLDQDLAHRTSLRPGRKRAAEPFVLPPPTGEATDSYCVWPARLVEGS